MCKYNECVFAICLILYIIEILIFNKVIMAVISVEVPDTIAKKFKSKRVISSYDLYEEIENNLTVDFWKKWVGKDEFLNYLANK